MSEDSSGEEEEEEEERERDTAQPPQRGLSSMLKAGAIGNLLEPLKLASGAYPQMHLAWELVLDGLLPPDTAGEEAPCDEAEEEFTGACTYAAALPSVIELWRGVV